MVRKSASGRHGWFRIMKRMISLRWGKILLIVTKMGGAKTLHEQVKKVEVNSGRREGVPVDVATQMKALERESRELRQANQILGNA